MARIDWEELKKDYVLGKYKSLKEFAEAKGIKYNSNLRERASGWKTDKVTKNRQKADKIVTKTIEKIAEKISDRNVRFLDISDMALDAVEEYLKNKHYKKHIIKYKIYVDGRPDSEELVAETLDVADTKALANMIASLEKIQKGQRLAEGLDKLEKVEEELKNDGFIDALNAQALEVWDDEED